MHSEASGPSGGQSSDHQRAIVCECLRLEIRGRGIADVLEGVLVASDGRHDASWLLW